METIADDPVKKIAKSPRKLKKQLALESPLYHVDYRQEVLDNFRQKIENIESIENLDKKSETKLATHFYSNLTTSHRIDKRG